MIAPESSYWETGMDLSQARLILMRHRDRLNEAKQQISALETLVDSFQRAVSMHVNGIASPLRESSRDLAALAGSGVNTEDINSMRAMYAAALENLDKARVLAVSVRPMKDDSLRNVRANLSMVHNAIDRNTR